jgi:hypothetical protein
VHGHVAGSDRMTCRSEIMVEVGGCSV